MRSDSRRIVMAWGALMALLALTCASAWWPIGIWNGVINLCIAACKAAIVALVFMHLGASGAVRACVGIALFVLSLIFALGGSDYATRDLHPAAWQQPAGATAMEPFRREVPATSSSGATAKTIARAATRAISNPPASTLP